jgi:hypothetical protein
MSYRVIVPAIAGAMSQYYIAADYRPLHCRFLHCLPRWFLTRVYRGKLFSPIERTNCCRRGSTLSPASPNTRAHCTLRQLGGALAGSARLRPWRSARGIAQGRADRVVASNRRQGRDARHCRLDTAAACGTSRNPRPLPGRGLKTSYLAGGHRGKSGKRCAPRSCTAAPTP